MSRDINLPITISDIDILDGRRDVNTASVKKLAESIDKIGLRHPITVREKGDRYILVAGRHRVEAFKKLGRDHIPATIVKMTNDDARLWEIAENLHRAELTKLERDENVAEWIKITERVLRQFDAKPAGGRPEGGVRAASRDLGIDEADARRAMQVSSLTDEAKEVARETGLDDNRSVLLAAVKQSDDVTYLRAEYARREAEKARKEAEKHNSNTDRVIALSAAEEFANWIMERTDLGEMPTIISWLEGTKAKDVIAAMRRAAA